jgi:hypothetical protein
MTWKTSATNSAKATRSARRILSVFRNDAVQVRQSKSFCESFTENSDVSIPAESLEPFAISQGFHAASADGLKAPNVIAWAGASPTSVGPGQPSPQTNQAL